MISSIAGLMSFPAKGRPGMILTEMNLVKGLGVESDMHKSSKRQVSLLSSQVHRWRKTEKVVGLCFKKFRANILIDDLPDKIASGTLIFIGDTVLKVNEKGKKCFDDCKRHANNIPCKISQNAAFATVEQGGTIKLGDSVIIE